VTFTLNRAALEAELSVLQSVAERKQTIPVLSTVRMDVADGLCRLVATDMDMALATEIPAAGEPWAGCVPSKQLHELVRLFNGDHIEFTPKDNERIQVKWGKSKHLLPVSPISLFPAVEQPQTATATIDGATLRTALERAARCVTPDALENWMQGIALRTYDDVLHIAATNSRQIAITAIPLPLAIDVLIPIRAAVALVKLLDDADVAFGATANHAVFQQGKRVFTTRLLDVKFPDWRPLLPPKYDHAVTLDAEPTRQAFRLAATTAKETALIPIPLRLTITSNEMLIETTESERGHSAEVVAIDCPTLNGDGLTRGVNGQHFIGFFDCDKAVMSFNGDMRIIQLSPEGEPNYRYITMSLK
jgi:DNA polymerase III subunit beta